MPKVNHCDIEALGQRSTPAKPQTKAKARPSRKSLENTIIDLFGMCLTLEDLLKVLGLRDRKCAKNWLAAEGIEAVEVNGRKRYLATDVAKALDNSKLRAV